MNKCYIMGKVLTEPIFNFFFMNDNISICYFFIKLNNNCEIKVFALNELADYVYQEIHTNQILIIDGLISSNLDKDLSIEVNNLKIIS